MQFTITDQMPAALIPLPIIAVTGDYDPIPALTRMLVDPIFEPLPGRTVTVTDDSGHTHDPDSIRDLFLRSLSDSVDVKANAAIKSLLAAALINYDRTTPLLVNETFLVQAASRCKLPAPGPRVLYSASSDVSPSARALLAQPGPDTADGFFAALGYTYAPETLGVWFRTETDFEDFKVWFDQQVNTLAPLLPADTVNLLQKFGQLTLKGLTESLVLRKDDDDEIQEYSFARVLVNLLTQYASLQASGTMPMPTTANAAAPPALAGGLLPFSVSELLLPRTVVLVNVEVHARTSPRRIEREWQIINASLNNPIKVVSNKRLSKLTALARAAAKASSQAANSASNQLAKAGRSARITFRKQSPNTVDILTGVTRALKRMKEVNRSQNIFRTQKTSFVKANRRDPMDFNKPGKVTSTRYLPDLHVYVDTSGSISESNYQQSMLMLIGLAKKLNVNLYFNSFSHVMSQQVLLRTAGKSTTAIWGEFQKIPKVSGGTDYEQIWKYINASPARSRRMSLIISDFEWRARSQRIEHPKNLYYAPCGNMDWDTLVYHASEFSKSVRHLEPAIAQRLIGMVA